MGKILVALYSKEDQKIIRHANRDIKKDIYVDWNAIFNKMIPEARNRYKRFSPK